ncbi:hypothetical protein GJ496_007527 [Pomphorhynchus laevis]|nr:hypothetical protein GJ496_007527 [Pomphorhynchus laevis]
MGQLATDMKKKPINTEETSMYNQPMLMYNNTPNIPVSLNSPLISTSYNTLPESAVLYPPPTKSNKFNQSSVPGMNFPGLSSHTQPIQSKIFQLPPVQLTEPIPIPSDLLAQILNSSQNSPTHQQNLFPSTYPMSQQITQLSGEFPTSYSNHP